MSYRAFKHLLGETSLERKCRFLLGAGILALITASFSWFAFQTEGLTAKPSQQGETAASNPREIAPARATQTGAVRESSAQRGNVRSGALGSYLRRVT